MTEVKVLNEAEQRIKHIRSYTRNLQEAARVLLDQEVEGEAIMKCVEAEINMYKIQQNMIESKSD